MDSNQVAHWSQAIADLYSAALAQRVPLPFALMWTATEHQPSPVASGTVFLKHTPYQAPRWEPPASQPKPRLPQVDELTKLRTVEALGMSCPEAHRCVNWPVLNSLLDEATHADYWQKALGMEIDPASILHPLSHVKEMRRLSQLPASKP